MAYAGVLNEPFNVIKWIKVQYHKVTSHKSVELLEVLFPGYKNTSAPVPLSRRIMAEKTVTVSHCCQDQDQVNTGVPLCQINFRDTVRGTLFGRKLASHRLDEALQLFLSFCLELRFFFKDAAICISARRPGFVWDAEGKQSFSFLSLFFF